MTTDIIVFDRKISSEYDYMEEIEDYDEEDSDKSDASDDEDDGYRIRKRILDFTLGLKRKKVGDVCSRVRERFREDLQEVRRVRLLEQHSQLLCVDLQPGGTSMSSVRRQLTLTNTDTNK